jgi:hypothetical protein
MSSAVLKVLLALPIVLSTFGVLPMPSDAISNEPISLKASTTQHEIAIGDQFKVNVELVNTTQKPLECKYVNPWIIFPEVWDESGKHKLPDAPSCAFDQISDLKSITLKPGEGIQLTAFPIILKDAPLGHDRDKEPPGRRAYWNAVKPGKYCLRYTADLKRVAPHIDGRITSNDVLITVKQ